MKLFSSSVFYVDAEFEVKLDLEHFIFYKFQIFLKSSLKFVYLPKKGINKVFNFNNKFNKH